MEVMAVRLRLLMPAIIVLAVLAWVTWPREPRPSDSVTPISGGSFHVTQFPLTSLDPLVPLSIYDSFVLNQIYEGLTGYSSALVPGPALASTWSISEDRRTYRFTLRPSLKFHDGSALTAESVVTAFERVVRFDAERPTVAHVAIGAIEGVKEWQAGRTLQMAGLHSPAPDQIEFRFTRPVPDLLHILAQDAFLITRGDGIGAGPFRLAAQSDSMLLLTASPSYHRGRAYLDSVVVHLDPEWDEEADLAAFDAGRSDLIETPNWELEFIRSRTDVVVHRRQGLTLEFIGFQTRAPSVSDPALRRRMATAIDWDRQSAEEGTIFRRATSLIPPGLPGFQDRPGLFDGSERSPRAVSRAGTRLVYHVPGVPGDPFPEDPELVSMWRKAGLPADLRILPWEEFDEALEARQMPIFSLGWVADYPSAPHFLYSLFHTDGWGNYFGYSDARVDSLLEAAFWEVDPDQRITLCRRAEDIVLKDLPVIPFRFPSTVWVVRSSLRGVELGPLGAGVLECEQLWWAR